MERPLYTFFFSLLAHTSNFVKVYFFYDGFAPDDLRRLEDKIRAQYNHFAFVLIENKFQVAESWKGLHGNTYVFSKLFLPQYVEEDRVLYLDVDIVVSIDIAELYAEDLGGCVLGASGIGTVESSLDTVAFGELGLAQGEAYFNSGMLLIDVAAWKRDHVTERCVELANRYQSRFASHDQSVLNFAFHKRFKALADRYNWELYPISKPLPTYPPAIYHFVGSPKPWDLGGRWLHSHYAFYAESLRRVGKTGVRFSPTKLYRRLRRSVLAGRQYARCIKNRLVPGEI